MTKASRPLVISPSSISAQPSESYPNASHGILTWKTLISAPQTQTNTLIAGTLTLPPKKGHLCPHRHTQAEIYHIISGSGVMEIDGVEYNVEAGNVVYIPGDAKHGIRNEGEEDLTWLWVFAADGFRDVVYRWEQEAEGEQEERAERG